MARNLLAKLLAEKRRGRQPPHCACTALALLALSAEIDAFVSAASSTPMMAVPILSEDYEGTPILPA